MRYDNEKIENMLAIVEALLPKAVSWAEQQAVLIASTGISLTDEQVQWAKHAGVQDVARIRIVELNDPIPLPSDEKLRRAAISIGLLGPDMLGLTLGYGVYIRRPHVNRRLLTHEFRHVFQYEQSGSITDFLGMYLMQVASAGYHDAPLEIDARNFEQYGL